MLLNCIKKLYIKRLSILVLCSVFISAAAPAHKLGNFISNMPAASKFFIGRKNEVDFIKDYFKKSLGKNLIVLVGSAGIGKTQIAKAYATLYSKNYNVIWWVDAEKNITGQLKNLIKEWNTQTTKENHIYINEVDDEITMERLSNALNKTTLNWLLIFDNASNRHEIDNYIQIRQGGNRGNIIVTTKNKIDWEHMKTIEKFQRTESIELLSRLTDSLNKEELNNLAETLNDYPLALTQAGSFIKMNPNISVQKYIELYQKERKRLWDYENKFFNRSADSVLRDDYSYTIKTTMDISLGKIKEESARAFELVSMLAFVSNENIPENMLKQYFKGDDLEMANALSLLMRYSLVDVKSNDLEKTYSIHEITQFVIQDGITESQKQNIIKVAADSLNKSIPTQLDLSIPLLSNKFYYLEQIENLCKHAEGQQQYDNAIINLYIKKLEYFLPGKRDRQATTELIEKIPDLIERTSNISNITKARFSLMKAAHLSWDLADYDESIEEAKQAEKYLKDYPDASEEYLMLYNSFAQTNMLKGELANALKYSKLGEEAIAKASGFLGNQDAFYATKAKILEDYGDIAEAYKNIEIALKKTQEIEERSKQTSVMIPVALLKAKLLVKLGKYEESYDMTVHIDKKINDIFGDKVNYITPAPMIIKAHCLQMTGKIKDAQFYIDKAISIFRALNLKKGYFAYAYVMEGDIKSKQRDYSGAQVSYLNAEKMYSDLLRKMEIDDVSSLYTKMAINCAKLKDSYSTFYYLNLHRKTFGESHKRTFEIIDYLHEHNLPIQ